MKIEKFWPREVWNEGTQVLGRVGSGKEKKKSLCSPQFCWVKWISKIDDWIPWQLIVARQRKLQTYRNFLKVKSRFLFKGSSLWTEGNEADIRHQSPEERRCSRRWRCGMYNGWKTGAGFSHETSVFDASAFSFSVSGRKINIYILCHCYFSLVPPNVNTFTLSLASGAVQSFRFPVRS